jgi:Tol biopolymer transport system component
VVKDLQTGATNLISVNRLGTGSGNGNSTSPLISGDGRFVVFTSKASDLVDNDTNNTSDIFVRDRLQGATLLVSLNRSGTGTGNAVSGRAALGPDGRTVVFQSFASDLVAGDYNDTRDLFVLRLAANDSDNDGMDDDWEIAHFGDLSRDGTGDFDGDGMTDLQEFLAGTDPTKSGSVLSVLSLTSLNSSSTTVLWSALPGKRYRVQFKNGLSDAGWSNLAQPVIANSTTGSLVDPASPKAQRFYRVVLLP